MGSRGDVCGSPRPRSRRRMAPSTHGCRDNAFRRHPVLRGAADIHKFFDQIQRDFVYDLAEKAGMPTQVITAYRNFLENLNAYIDIGQGIGHKYSRKCGIPQGCPLSMSIVALLMRAWIIEMRMMEVEAKVLADEVLMIAQGKHMLRKYAKALDYTHQYLQDMGSKVAPAKSYNFASTDGGRKWLKETWGKKNATQHNGCEGHKVPRRPPQHHDRDEAKLPLSKDGTKA